VMCRMQWSELKAAIAPAPTLCRGFGNKEVVSTATVYVEGQPLGSPDPWDLGMGIGLGSSVDGKCPPARARLRSASPPHAGGRRAPRPPAKRIRRPRRRRARRARRGDAPARAAAPCSGSKRRRAATARALRGWRRSCPRRGGSGARPPAPPPRARTPVRSSGPPAPARCARACRRRPRTRPAHPGGSAPRFRDRRARRGRRRPRALPAETTRARRGHGRTDPRSFGRFFDFASFRAHRPVPLYAGRDGNGQCQGRKCPRSRGTA
jgi:hypothetical protein